MNDTETRQWAERLDAREQTLQREVRDKVMEAEAESPQETADAVDRADDTVRVAMRQAERERDVDELEAIVAARGRLAGGSYGACVGCGRESPRERLDAGPWAARCLPCQTRAEAGRLVGVRVQLPPGPP